MAEVMLEAAAWRLFLRGEGRERFFVSSHKGMCRSSEDRVKPSAAVFGDVRLSLANDAF